MPRTELQNLFSTEIRLEGNFLRTRDLPQSEVNQDQTKDTFSEKWTHVDSLDSRGEYHRHALDWFLQLYGFADEGQLADFLKDKPVIFDAGCGLGFKAAWLARLAPKSTVIGMDISDAAKLAAAEYRDIGNLYFINGDIADTGLRPGSMDFVVCDQVIMHTEDPEKTFAHLVHTLKPGAQFACYVYAQKALPRELIDDYFRKGTHEISSERMWEFSAQLTELGKRLSELNVMIESPDIPLLGIKAGEYDIQRFIYWNFLKCFWNPDWGFEMSKVTNFDWYSPSNATRYTRAAFEQIIEDNSLSTLYFHAEEACYSGRFLKN
jgi:SAM-dependent methyltransferase